MDEVENVLKDISMDKYFGKITLEEFMKCIFN